MSKLPDNPSSRSKNYADHMITIDPQGQYLLLLLTAIWEISYEDLKDLVQEMSPSKLNHYLNYLEQRHLITQTSPPALFHTTERGKKVAFKILDNLEDMIALLRVAISLPQPIG